MSDIPDLGQFDPGDIPEGFDPRRLIMPGHFAGPHEMPVHVDVSGVYDERGVWWVLLRVETVHGSFITFLQPNTALSMSSDLEASVQAMYTTPFVPPGQHN
jgi:hypothetical protein